MMQKLYTNILTHSTLKPNKIYQKLIVTSNACSAVINQKLKINDGHNYIYCFYFLFSSSSHILINTMMRRFGRNGRYKRGCKYILFYNILIVYCGVF